MKEQLFGLSVIVIIFLMVKFFKAIKRSAITDVEAQYAMGNNYFYGRGVSQNYKLAFYFFLEGSRTRVC